MKNEDWRNTKLSDMLITPVRPVVPNVGRNAVTPQRAAGYVTEPAVSDPIANGTIPVKDVFFRKRWILKSNIGQLFQLLSQDKTPKRKKPSLMD